MRAALAVCAACATASTTGAELAVSLRARDGRPVQGAVIMAESLAPQPAVPPAVHAIMDQVNLAFVPDVMVIPVHSTVHFPNSDAVSHQVYSFSSARQFQLPLYRGKPYPPVQFDQPGVVTLGCNIHDSMLGYIVVTTAAFFGRTDRNGAWSATAVPPGRYRVHAWHPMLNERGEPSQLVDLADTGAAIELELTKPLRPAPLGTRPHSWEY